MAFLTLKPFILGTEFVSVTDRKSYVSFQMAVSLLMFADLEGSKVKVTNLNHLITLKLHFRHKLYISDR